MAGLLKRTSFTGEIILTYLEFALHDERLGFSEELYEKGELYDQGEAPFDSGISVTPL